MSRPIAILAFALALAWPATAPAQRGKVAEARSVAAQAEKKANAGDYAEAVEGFRKAYDLNPSPAYLYNIAIVYLDALDDPRAALGWATRYAGAARNVSERRDAERLVKRIDALLARRYGEVAVAVDPPEAEAFLDVSSPEARIGRSALVAPGSHVIRAWAPGFEPGEARIAVEAGVRTEVKLALRPVKAANPEPASGATVAGHATEVRPAPAHRETVPEPVMAGHAASARRVAGWTTIGVGAAMAAAGAVTFGLAWKDARDAGALRVEAAGYASYSRRYDSLWSRARQERVAAIALWGVGGAALVTGVVLALLPERAGVAFAPGGPGGAGITLTGRW